MGVAVGGYMYGDQACCACLGLRGAGACREGPIGEGFFWGSILGAHPFVGVSLVGISLVGHPCESLRGDTLGEGIIRESIFRQSLLIEA